MTEEDTWPFTEERWQERVERLKESDNKRERPAWPIFLVALLVVLVLLAALL